MSDFCITWFEVVIRDPRPVSVNKLYGPNGLGGVRLKTDGKKFKSALKAAVAQEITTHGTAWPVVMDAIYNEGCHVRLKIRLFFEKMHNGSWKPGGSKTKSGNRRSPYQKKDASNYVKIIEDALVEGTGIDDSVHLSVHVAKAEDKDDPRVEVTYEVYE